jgi:hypothetical protein
LLCSLFPILPITVFPIAVFSNERLR